MGQVINTTLAASALNAAMLAPQVEAGLIDMQALMAADQIIFSAHGTVTESDLGDADVGDLWSGVWKIDMTTSDSIPGPSAGAFLDSIYEAMLNFGDIEVALHPDEKGITVIQDNSISDAVSFSIENDDILRLDPGTNDIERVTVDFAGSNVLPGDQLADVFNVSVLSMFATQRVELAAQGGLFARGRIDEFNIVAIPAPAGGAALALGLVSLAPRRRSPELSL